MNKVTKKLLKKLEFCPKSMTGKHSWTKYVRSQSTWIPEAFGTGYYGSEKIVDKFPVCRLCKLQDTRDETKHFDYSSPTKSNFWKDIFGI
mgnify:FL=1